MFTQSLSPSLLFSQHSSSLEETGKNYQSSEKVIEHKQQNRLTADFYEPITRNESSNVNSKMTVQQVISSNSQSATIQLETKQGDIVVISLSKSAISSYNAFDIQQGDSQFFAKKENQSVDSRFSMDIKGDLNKDELKSINKLLKKMDKVSHHFFSGNIKAAFKHAKKVGLETQQIASFSVDLYKEKSIQAVAAYQQTTLPEQRVDTDMLKHANKFLLDTKALMADTQSMLDSFKQPKQIYTELLASMGQLHHDTFNQERDNKQLLLFSTIIENISNDIFET